MWVAATASSTWDSSTMTEIRISEVEIISTSEIRISVVVRAEHLDAAVQAVHTAFELDATDEATVYAGTGR